MHKKAMVPLFSSSTPLPKNGLLALIDLKRFSAAAVIFFFHS